MTVFSSRQFPILFHKRWTTTGLASAIQAIDVDALCTEYHALRKAAPSRSDRDKLYFVGHRGHVQAKNPRSPSEEHLAIALWQLDPRWPRPAGDRVRLLDYQFPLKASRSDTGMGKVDLLGATDHGRLAVIELKVRRNPPSRGDTPLLALMEGLRYAAIVHANHAAIAVEARDCFAIDLSDEPPIVQILAPEDWWRGWCDMVPSTRRAAGPWESKFVELSSRLEARLGIVIDCASLQGTGLADITWDPHGPRLRQTPPVRQVRLDAVPGPTPATRPRVAGTVVDYTGYEKALVRRLWGWAGRYHSNELDGGSRTDRPPVLGPKFASKAVLVPSNPARARSIVSAVPERERHRWFRSLKSSQALAQSVFGAIGAFGRLDLLDAVVAECGRPAFLAETRGASLVLEHKVHTLGEPRRTSVDVLLEGRFQRVGVECKFMEREFGVCSRPKLRPRDPTYAEQHCDGNYRIQRGRRERCALTEIGVRYWTYLPQLFDWNADQDLQPCPFSPAYQIARNALAATVTDTGLDANSGHVLVVYDARNPEFAIGGAARQQYESAIAACRISGLIRRVSWQRLAVALAAAPELAYLVAALEGKYGITAA